MMKNCKIIGNVLLIVSIGVWFGGMILVTDAQLDRIRGYINNLESRIESISRRFDLNTSIQSLFQDVADFRQQVRNIGNCYVGKLENEEIDIWGDNMTIIEVVKKYYQAFPEKRITAESIRSLMSSISDIFQSCVDQNTNTSSSSNSTRGARYGFTELSDNSDNQIRQMLGTIDPEQSNGFSRAKRLTGSDSQCMPSGGGNGQQLPDRYDWRDHNVVTKPKSQGSCGSCWAFATVGSIESAYLINNKTSSNQEIDLSEQEVVDCAKTRGCQGGYALQAFRFARDNGLTSESQDPYRARSSYCSFRRNFPTVAKISNYCIRSRFQYSRNFMTESLTDLEIMEALVEFGPLYITIDANSRMTRNYRGGIMNGPCSTRINHAVLLVGYTKDSWIIKNSWGTAWGDGGFFQLEKSGSNTCGIHTEIAYPIL